MDPQTVGTQFLQHYYNLFDTSRSQLASLLTDDSMLTYENQQVGPRRGMPKRA